MIHAQPVTRDGCSAISGRSLRHHVEVARRCGPPRSQALMTYPMTAPFHARTP
jgi:hypothetical protein